MLGKIRRLHLRDKKSLHEIARATGLSRNTIRRWLRMPDEAAAPVYRRNEQPGKLTAFHEALEQALKADSHRAKQYQRTAKALLAQIKADGYTGGYSVPCELAGQRVGTRLYPDRVCTVAADAIVASHERSAARGNIRYDWQHYIALVQHKPGALRNGAPFADMPAPLQRLRQGLPRRVGGDRVANQTLRQLLECPLSKGQVAMCHSCRLATQHVQ